jgi:hypothetical protein
MNTAINPPSNEKRPWLRPLGMIFGSATIVGEGIVIIIWFAWHAQTHIPKSWTDLILPVLGIIAGAWALLAGFNHQPTEAQAESKVPEPEAPKPPEQAILSYENSFPDATTVPVRRENPSGTPSVVTPTRNDIPPDLNRRPVTALSGTSERPSGNDERLATLNWPEISSYTVYAMPKEGNAIEISQDKYDDNTDIDKERFRFAVADGVGGSFLPSMWAEIVVKNFVNLKEDFRLEDARITQKFGEWLMICSNEWSNWAQNDWIPKANERRGTPYDWSSDLVRGAETTLIGCSFSPRTLAETGHTNILVTAVGDSVFFLVRRAKEQPWQWQCDAFAVDKPESFGPTPDTLATAKMDAQSILKCVKQKIYTNVYPGDYVFLTTDALAKWILTQIKLGNTPWPELLSLTSYSAFQEFVIRERGNRTLELDDTTMMVIPILKNYESYKSRKRYDNI